MTKEVVIIGAGISGLATAFFLKRQGVHVTLLESDSQVGGTIRTYTDSGFLVERGPNSILDTTPLLAEMISEIGLSDSLVFGNNASENRYILRNGKLCPVSPNPIVLLKSDILSFAGKVRILLEPFHRRAHTEETVSDFVKRRLGKEFLDYLIGPFVSGIWAGNPDKLSIRHAFPKVWQLESRYGGLFLGAIRSKAERKKRQEKSKNIAKLFSFKNGLCELPNALSKYLGDSVRLSSTVLNITKSGREFIVNFRSDGQEQQVICNAVVISTLACVASEILKHLSPEFARLIRTIYYPPVSVVALGFRNEDIDYPLNGFGFLVPTVENRKILGALWNSSLFPNRAPTGYALLTTFVGGATRPESQNPQDTNLLEIVTGELKSILGIKRPPEFTHIARWSKAIPQYDIGYSRIVSAIKEFEVSFLGIFLCANYIGGISVGDCVKSAHAVANRIVQFD
jgi:oxygen-dependent protoporphyrinogen oxidase